MTRTRRSRKKAHAPTPSRVRVEATDLMMVSIDKGIYGKPVIEITVPDIEDADEDHRFAIDRLYLGELIDGLQAAARQIAA